VTLFNGEGKRAKQFGKGSWAKLLWPTGKGEKGREKEKDNAHSGGGRGNHTEKNEVRKEAFGVKPKKPGGENGITKLARIGKARISLSQRAGRSSVHLRGERS